MNPQDNVQQLLTEEDSSSAAATDDKERDYGDQQDQWMRNFKSPAAAAPSREYFHDGGDSEEV